jgi:hypothetical protein
MEEGKNIIIGVMYYLALVRVHAACGTQNGVVRTNFIHELYLFHGMWSKMILKKQTKQNTRMQVETHYHTNSVIIE